MGKKWSSETKPYMSKQKVTVDEQLQQHEELSEDDELKAFLEKGSARASSSVEDDHADIDRRYETAVDHLVKEKSDSETFNSEVSPKVELSQQTFNQQNLNQPKSTRQQSNPSPSVNEDAITELDGDSSFEVSEKNPLEATIYVKEVFSGDLENNSSQEDMPEWLPMDDQHSDESSPTEIIEPVSASSEVEMEKIESPRADKLDEYRQFNSDDKIDLIEEHQNQIQRATTINTANALTLKYIVFGAIFLILILALGLGLVSYKFRKQIDELNQIISNPVLKNNNQEDTPVDEQQTITDELTYGTTETDDLLKISPATPLISGKKYRESDYWKESSSSDKKKGGQKQQSSAGTSSFDDEPINYTVEPSEEEIDKKKLTEKSDLAASSQDNTLAEEIISKLNKGDFDTPIANSKGSKDPSQRNAPVYKNTVLDNNGWVVNLGAFQAGQPAQRAADKYIKKGVPVEVVQITIGGQKWYRLRVEGFESKDEAVMYSTRVKKALKLDNVWVTVN